MSQACRHVKDKIRNDKKLERKIAKIEKKLNASRMDPVVFRLVRILRDRIQGMGVVSNPVLQKILC